MKALMLGTKILIIAVAVFCFLGFPAITHAQVAPDCPGSEFELECVTPDPVTFVDPTCDQQGSYTVPNSVGTEYFMGNFVVAAGTYDATNGTTVDINASPLRGYAFFTNATTSWSHDFTDPTNCEQPAPAPVAQVTSTPVGPVHAGVGYSSSKLPALIGLAGSLSLLGFGLYRKFAKS